MQRLLIQSLNELDSQKKGYIERIENLKIDKKDLESQIDGLHEEKNKKDIEILKLK
jgi:uncharacterized protein (UPF0335 family)